MLGLRFCARAFSSCGKQGPLFIVVHGTLTIAASVVVEHRLQMRRLSSCGTWAQLLCSIWDLPEPELEPVSPALAGGFSTTAPPGKPMNAFFLKCIYPFSYLFKKINLKHSSNIHVCMYLCLSMYVFCRQGPAHYAMRWEYN